MTPHELLEAFETLADAPDGVKRLRELVLQLAVRGKLVPQDSSEGRVSPSETPPSPDEVSFTLPEQWAWLRLPEVADYSVGKTPPTKDPRFWGTNEIPWVSIGDMPDGGVIRATARTVTQDAAADVFRKPKIPTGSLLMSFKLTIGKVAFLGVDAYHNEAIISLIPASNASKDYLFRVLPLRAIGGESKAAIMGSTLNGQSLGRILVPLPPLAEQHRIVARVDELMGLLDRLETARAARDEIRHAARDAALAALREAEDTEAFELAWTRISGQMDILIAAPADVVSLRTTILELAGRGRLTRQDDKDEPATVALRRLAETRSQKIRDGALRDYALSDDEDQQTSPFDVPNGWHWCALHECAAAVPRAVQSGPFGSMLRHSEFQETGLLVIGIDNVQDGKFSLGSNHRLSETKAGELLKYSARPGDLLITVMGTIGRCCVVPDALEPAIITKHVYRITLSAEVVVPRYFMHLIRGAPFMRDQIFSRSRGLTRDGLNGTLIKGFLLPLPPLAEQHRIVAKVDALMALCDALEARLTAACELQAQFAAAAVHHLNV